MFSRSTPALCRGRASCARRMPFVVRHSSATPGTARSMAHSSGISRRTRGSLPVMRIFFTPNRAAGGALLGHLAGGAALYGASVPGDPSVMLSVYEGGSVITLDQVESREGLRIVSDIGSRLPVFCTSQGKVFLAHMSRAVLEREIPAIPVAMWMEGLKVTPRAMLSRAVAGIRGSSLLLNLPGSEKAARENLAAVIEALEHGLHMIAAEGHE